MHKKLKSHQQFNSSFYRIPDIIITIISVFVSLLVSSFILKENIPVTSRLLGFILLAILIWSLLFEYLKLSRISGTGAFKIILFRILNLEIAGLIILVLFYYAIGIKAFPVFTLFIFGVLNMAGLFSYRIISRFLLKRDKSTKKRLQYIILLAGESAEKLITKILEHKEWGIRISGIVTSSEIIQTKFDAVCKVFPENVNLKNLLQADDIDELIWCKKTSDRKELGEIAEMCHELDINFKIQSVLNYQSGFNTSVSYLDNIPLLTVEKTRKNSVVPLIRSFMEMLFALLLLFFVSPILIVVSAAVSATSKGPAIYKQARVDKTGRRFYIYKFRTVTLETEVVEQHMDEGNIERYIFNMNDGPQMTLIGKLLKKSGIEIWPQLFNVIKGDMSFFGPCLEYIKDIEKSELLHYDNIAAKPGLICSKSKDTLNSESDFDRDVQYMESWSVRNELRLFVHFVKSIFFSK
ncbi:MAG: sugar transferase [Bacteroidales bacterium]|nr:sugar transferase [Bacteroidales bacterium]